MLVLSTIASILSIVPIASASFENLNVQNTCWTYGETEDGAGKLWIGLNKFVVDYNGEESSTSWNSADCTDSFCKDCKEACLDSVSFAITNFITSIPNIRGNYERAFRATDRNCEKNFAVLTGVIGFLSALSSLSIYANSCGRNLPDEINGVAVYYQIGPGFVCLLVAVLLLPFNVVANLLTPVPPKGSDLTESLTESGSSDDDKGATKL
jgi:amino acid transporter